MSEIFMARVLHCSGGIDPHRNIYANEVLHFCEEWLRVGGIQELLRMKIMHSFGKSFLAYGIACLGVENHGIPRSTSWVGRTFNDWLTWPTLTPEYQAVDKAALVRRLKQDSSTEELLTHVRSLIDLPEEREGQFLVDVEGHGLLRQLDRGKWVVALDFFRKNL